MYLHTSAHLGMREQQYSKPSVDTFFVFPQCLYSWDPVQLYTGIWFLDFASVYLDCFKTILAWG